jgi:cytochrome d ubiquinol oxidase subunit I
MWIRFFHTVDAALITGAFFVAGISAYLILKKKGVALAKKSLRMALIFGFIFSVLELFPFGHEHTKQVAHTQPEKFAALEGLYDSQSGAPLVLFGLVNATPPELAATLEIPGLLSWLAFGDIDAHVQGLDAFPEDERPPLWLTFVSFHNMVILGMFFIGVTLVGLFLLWRKKLFDQRWFLKILVISIPLPVAACQFGWVAAEVGRQPWAVYKILKTVDAVSVTVSAGEILFSLILFGLIYIFMFALYVYVLVKKINRGPEERLGKEAAT